MGKNSLETDFVFNERDSFKKIDSLENRLTALDKKLNALGGSVNFGGNLQTQLTNAVSPVDKMLQKAQSDIARYQKQTLDGEKAITKSVEREAKLQADAKIREQKRAANEFLRTLNQSDDAPKNSPGRIAGNPASRPPAGNDLKLSSFQKQNLSYQLNDVLTGLASGQKPTQILSQQGGQIAQIFNPAQIAAFTASYAGLVTVLGAGAVAIAATYKITGDMRAEAERRLKVEERLTAEWNKQFLNANRLTKEYREQVELDQKRREFGRYLQDNKKISDLPFLEQRKVTLEKLAEVNSYGPEGSEMQKRAEIYRQQASEIRAQMDAIRQEEKAGKYKMFAISAELYGKQVEAENRIEDEKAKRAAEAQKKFAESVETGKAKVKDLEKTYLSVLDNLYAKRGNNNPFVSLLTESDKAMRELRQNTRGLRGEFAATAASFEAMLQKQNEFALKSARVDNRVDAFDLRQSAENFRNPFDKDRQTLDQDAFLQSFLRNNPNFLYLETGYETFRGGYEDEQYIDSKGRMKTRKKKIKAPTLDGKPGNPVFADSDGGFFQLDENLRSRILERFAPSSLLDSPKDRLNKSLNEKYDLLYGNGRLSEKDRALADKSFISATNGVDPLQLDAGLRERAAQARENEAIRRERYEADALQLYREQKEFQRQIAENTRRQNEIAEKLGEAGIKLDITTKDESNTTRTTARPTAANSANDFVFGGFSLAGGTNR